MSYRLVNANELVNLVDIETQEVINDMPCIFADIKPENQHINIEEIRADERAKVLDVVSDVLAKMNNICGRSCPVDCEWGTEESCKEQWKKYLIKQLDENIVKGE